MDMFSSGRDESRANARPLPATGRPGFGQGAASALSMKWAALHDAAGAVALIAALEPEPMTAELRNFPAIMREAGGWRRVMAEQGIADLSAIMEPGLSALLAVNARGHDARPAARVLWEEFLSARNALLALAPPRTGKGPLRRA